MSAAATAPVFLETERLSLRQWTLDDVEDAHAMYSDPEITRFLGGMQPHATLLETRTWLEGVRQRHSHRTDGMGAWALIEKHTRIAIGTVLLKELPDATPQRAKTKDIEIGWHLRRDRWKRGYVHEAARALLVHAFHTLKLPIVYAVVDTHNLASQRVATRLGMRHVGTTRAYYGGELLELFETRDPPA